ncbi:MAG: hypothetical protein IOD12_01805 [Silvanigrellales bacterium]|nr:hypothetical protein [Silvanigrellales bacterium]
MLFSGRKWVCLFGMVLLPIIESCKSRSMNDGVSRSFSTFGPFEICGSPFSTRENAKEVPLLFLRTDWKTETRISEAFGASRNWRDRYVEVTFRTGLPPSLKVESWNSEKFACVQGELSQNRIVAQSFTIRNSLLEDQEIRACGEIFEEVGLFGVHVASKREKSAVLLVGRNTKKTRSMLHALVGEHACVRGRPFLAQENLALLTDSTSIIHVRRNEMSLTSEDKAVESGHERARMFIDSYRYMDKETQIRALTDHILEREKKSEEEKWDAIEWEVNGRDSSLPRWLKTRADTEIIDCCDRLNELVGEKKSDGFFSKLRRGGASPANMYMDGKNDFSEIKKIEVYDGDEDLELDLL